LLLYPQYALQVEDGDFDGALATLRAMVHASRPLADAPRLLSNLIATAVRVFVANGVERLLSQAEPPAALLNDVQRLLEPDADRAALLPAFRGQRALYENTMRALDDGRVSWDELSKVLPGPRRTGWPNVDAWLNRLLGRDFDRANVTAQVRYYTWTIERLKESPDGLIEHANEWADVGDQMPDRANAMVGSLSRYVVETAVNDARFRSAIAALAAERFRQANGRWPSTLDELVPSYLTAIPRDPFKSQPLRMARHPGGIVIYSVGQDKADDGGDVRTGQPKGRDDGVRLWDVDRRRQPPKQKLPPD
jgi:hypothetical protein